MFFSVIVPIYNAEKTLKRCLDSLVAQVYPDFQAILVDDGSSDNSLSIAEEYAARDSRFVCIHQENSGVSATRNAGLAHARGEFITFLDSDDVYFPDYFQEFHKLISSHPTHDCFLCGFEYITNDSSNGMTCLFSANENVSLVHREKIMSLHQKTLEASPVNKAYRTSIIHANQLQMELDLSLGEDLLFNYSYIDNCHNPEVVVLNKSLYGYYCFSDDSLNHKYRADLKQIYDRLNKKTLFYLQKWGVSSEQLSIFYNSVFYRYEKVLSNTFRKESPLTKREKYQCNNTILSSDEFRQALALSNCYLHPLYRLAYRLARYRLVQMVDSMVKVSNKFKKWLRKNDKA